MFRLVSSKLVNITKSLAREFAAMETERDRPVKEHLLIAHRNAIKNGLFRQPQWVSAYCEENGKTYRVNGKHTSIVFSELDDISGHKVTVEHYNCDTVHDVTQLFSTFDSKKSARSNGDIYRFWAASVDSIADVRSRIITVSVFGMAYAYWEDNTYLQPPTAKAQLLNDHPSFVLFVDNLLVGDYRHMNKSPVIAAVFKSWQKSQKDAQTFWEMVRDGSGSPNTTADRVLNRYLLSTSSATGRGTKTGKKMAGQMDIYLQCLQQWKLWRQGAPGALKRRCSKKLVSA